jgi:ectoine hydroxylase-related dioxygenase (phytanoyl-CoA dioxygenase family)
MEQLIGPNIMLKSTRLFYKPGRSDSFVGWHQDGLTEQVKDACVPAIWLGLTPATVENGCLRVVPQSHRLGLVPHADFPNPNNLTTQGATAQVSIGEPHDVVMRAGEMSLHHPLMLHASDPNHSNEARIGFSATYSTPALSSSRTAVAWVRGDGPRDRFRIVEKPPWRSIEEAVAAYLAGNHQVLFSK